MRLFLLAVILIQIPGAWAQNMDVDLNTHCRKWHGERSYATRNHSVAFGWLCTDGQTNWDIDMNGACREIGGGGAVRVGSLSNNGWQCLRGRVPAKVPGHFPLDLNDHCRRWHGYYAHALNSPAAANGWLCSDGQTTWDVDLNGACRELGGRAAVRVGKKTDYDWQCLGTRSRGLEQPSRNFDVDLNSHCRRWHGESAAARKEPKDRSGWRCASGGGEWFLDVDGACRELGGRAAVRDPKANNGWKCLPGQRLPNCKVLSDLWEKTYYGKLRPNWAPGPLACGYDVSELTDQERVAMLTARAAYVLDRTEFFYQKLDPTPIIPGQKVTRPPASMLDWVARRLKGLVYVADPGTPYADQVRGLIHISRADYDFEGPLNLGVGLAGQIIHETRHIGIPVYGHVKCATSAGHNCDPTVTEDFESGGSHAVAALWLSWIGMHSSWPLEEKEMVLNTVSWVLRERINAAPEVRAQFSWKYLGKPL